MTLLRWSAPLNLNPGCQDLMRLDHQEMKLDQQEMKLDQQEMSSVPKMRLSMYCRHHIHSIHHFRMIWKFFGDSSATEIANQPEASKIQIPSGAFQIR
uniref:Ovule protein n=1 Tax=Globodera pallida TaxID=36090 RepID=A0A183BXR3_GLOPA